ARVHVEEEVACLVRLDDADRAGLIHVVREEVVILGEDLAVLVQVGDLLEDLVAHVLGAADRVEDRQERHPVTDENEDEEGGTEGEELAAILFAGNLNGLVVEELDEAFDEVLETGG